MARPQRVSEERILSAAREIFLRDGPSASTVEIAERLGLSQPALYKRFKSKKHLMIAALAAPEPSWLEMLRAGPDPRTDVATALEAIARSVLDYLESVLAGLTVLRAAGCTPQEIFGGEVPWPIRMQDELSEWFQLLGKQGRAHVPHPKALAMTLIGALSHLQFMVHMTSTVEDPDAALTAIVASVWGGMRPQDT